MNFKTVSLAALLALAATPLSAAEDDVIKVRLMGSDLAADIARAKSVLDQEVGTGPEDL